MEHPIGDIVKSITSEQIITETPPSKAAAALLWSGLGLAAYLLTRENKEPSKKNPKGKYHVPSDLLEKYISAIRVMEQCRGLDSKYYYEMDKERAKLHDEILAYVKTDRDDKDFALWLAFQVEGFSNFVEENPKSPEDYAKLFSIFKDLRASKIEQLGQYAMDSSENWIAGPAAATKNIISHYRKTDRIETYLQLDRYAHLSRYFRNISKGIIDICVGAILKETELGDEKLNPEYINERLAILDNILIDPTVAKAFSIWKNFYLKSTFGTSKEDYSKPIVISELKNDPRAKYILKEFPVGTWKYSFLTELSEGFNIFDAQYDRTTTFLQRLEHYNSMLNTNRNFSNLANDIAWNMYDIPETFKKLHEAEEIMIERTRSGKELEEADEQVFVDLGDWKWVIADAREEAEMMGHCGREAENMIMLSLRHYDKKKKIVTAHVSVAFYWAEEEIIDDEHGEEKNISWGYVTQMKGKGNKKPAEKYHPYIMGLLLDGKVQAKLPGEYRPQDDFQIDDLKIHEIEELKEKKKQLFSLIDFKKIRGAEDTLKLLKARGIELGEKAKIEGDLIIINTWEDEDSFVKDIGVYTDRSTREDIKRSWDWVQEPHDLTYNLSWKENSDAIDDLIDGLEKKHPEDYKKLEAYLNHLYPTETPRDALDSINKDNPDHPLIDAFLRAVASGEETGFSSNAHDEFLRSLEEIAWYSGVYISVEHKPFKIGLYLDMQHFDKLLAGELEIDYPENLFGEIEHGFKMRDVDGKYDEEYALSDLVEMRLPDAWSEISKEKNPIKRRKKHGKKHADNFRFRELSSLPLVQKVLTESQSGKRSNRDSGQGGSKRTRAFSQGVA